MRSAIAQVAAHAQRAQRRQRSASLSTVPPASTSTDYLPELAATAASILYRSPLPSKDGRPIYILNAAAFPDSSETDFDSLLPYVLARLPGEEELLSGTEYEIVFFAGGQPDNATSEKKQGPGMGWYLQAYHVLSRATRKKLQRLYIVHPRTWVRVLVGVFGTVVSPKFRRKIITVNTLSALALNIPIETLLIPPAVYLHDRKLSLDIYAPFATGRRAFGVKHPFPRNLDTGRTRLPRILRETTSFLLQPACVKIEGIFRIPPNSTLAGAIKEAYDRGQKFIVYKEQNAAFAQPSTPTDLLSEIRLEEAYSVHLAASLIKQWYRDLRAPIFPESTYPTIRSRYGDPNTPLLPEDLVDLLLPISEASPLSPVARKILTRHLLPTLSAVAEHSADNKMSAENLAICFSMCLLCGSNQMEDAKFAAVLSKVLRAAIEMWPALQAGMEIGDDVFMRDLQPPSDARDYEDPLEEELPPRTPLHGQPAEEDFPQESHRIVLEDSEVASTSGGAPAEAAWDVLRGKIKNRPRAPTLPPRPSSIPADRAAQPGQTLQTSVPKRKPAPSPPFQQTNERAPSRSSTDPTTDSRPSSQVFFDMPVMDIPVPRRKAVGGNSPESSGENSRVVSHDMSHGPPSRNGSTLAVSTAVLHSEPNTSVISSSPVEVSGPQLPSTTKSSLTASKGARSLPLPNITTASPVTTEVPSSASPTFRKPSWPASSRPIVPQRQALAGPLPLGARPTDTASSPIDGLNVNGAPSPSPTTATFGGTVGVPRTRGPSPRLLKRMGSMESGGIPSGPPTPGEGSGTERGLLEPKKLDMRKQSVEDLRRLYEERGKVSRVLSSGSLGSGGGGG